MIVYHPKDSFSALKLWPCFIDFLINQINEDKIEIGLKNYHLYGFEIWLVKSKDIEKEIQIRFSYNPIWGYEVATPIERFSLELSQGVISKASIKSQHPSEYDKMLELFKSCLSYLERHDQEHHKRILGTVELDSLDRKNWKRSRESIEEELNRNTDMRLAAKDFERKKKEALTNLISKYADQGYEITE